MHRSLRDIFHPNGLPATTIVAAALMALSGWLWARSVPLEEASATMLAAAASTVVTLWFVLTRADAFGLHRWLLSAETLADLAFADCDDLMDINLVRPFHVLSQLDEHDNGTQTARIVVTDTRWWCRNELERHYTLVGDTWELASETATSLLTSEFSMPCAHGWATLTPSGVTVE